MWDDSFKDFEQFWFGNFSVVILVNGSDELVDFLLSDLSSLTHVLKGIVDQLGDFTWFKSSTFVLVIGIEYSVDCVSEKLN